MQNRSFTRVPLVHTMHPPRLIYPVRSKPPRSKSLRPNVAPPCLPQIKPKKPVVLRSTGAGLGAGLLVFFVICLSGADLYLRSAAALKDEVQRSLKRSAITMSTLVDADTHGQFTDRAQEKSAAYQNALAPLARVLHVRKDIKYIYTCVLKNNKVFFVLDPTPDSDHKSGVVDDKSHIGQAYPEAPPEMMKALRFGTCEVDPHPYTDEWGTYISAYAPLKNRSGKSVGIVGLDVSVDNYTGRLAGMKNAALLSLGLGLLISLGIGIVVQRLFLKIETARDVLECRVKERTSDLAKANAVLLQEVAERERAMTALRASEEHLAHQAFHDPLTHLPNRALFVDRLRRSLARCAWRGRFVAVLFLDLNDFKVINDSLGHEAGDKLLVLVAKQLQMCLRPGDTVARLGGDEFTVLLDELHDISEAERVAERIVEALRLPMILQGREVFTGASIGLAISSEGDSGDPEHSDRLLRDADTAMYEAKTGCSSSRWVVFDRRMNREVMERLELEADLRRALLNHEFRVFYQPIIRLDSGMVDGMEALVRWLHPTQGLVSPARFIPLAEENGIIVALGKWVLEEACRQTAHWHAQYSDRPPLVISVNLSGRQLQEASIVADIAEVLQATGLPAEFLKLELTESVMMVDAETTIAKLYAIKDLGVRLAVDDFGTGYSSMAYLSHFPLDTLKIDRSFVSRLNETADEDGAIVRAIVTLAKTLNLRVTGEGIETGGQMQQLRDLGCDFGQGYHFAHPLTKEAMEGLLTQARRKQSVVSEAELTAEIPQAHLPSPKCIGAA